MGAYDEDEHERRAGTTAEVDGSVEDGRTAFRGTLEFDAGDSAEALVDQFREFKLGVDDG
jgi:hypothetical protein